MLEHQRRHPCQVDKCHDLDGLIVLPNHEFQARLPVEAVGRRGLRGGKTLLSLNDIADHNLYAKFHFRKTRAMPEWLAVAAIIFGTDRVCLRVTEFPGMANYKLESTSPYVVLGGPPYVFDTNKNTTEELLREMKATLRILYGSSGKHQTQIRCSGCSRLWSRAKNAPLLAAQREISYARCIVLRR